jgi:hypothetical protein
MKFCYDSGTFGTDYLDRRISVLESKGWYVVSIPRVRNNSSYFEIVLRRDREKEVNK